ncbi:helix-turn-helix domain-containing protein [Alsobacter sp. R-9]
MITGRQLHAGRVLAGLSRRDLAGAAGVGADELADLEDSADGVLPERDLTVLRLIEALGGRGVELGYEGGPHVWRREPSRDEGLRPEALNAGNDG